MTASPDIVLLHGWAIGSYVWDDFVKKVESRLPNARVTALDLPGYGKRQAESVTADIAKLADLCLEEAPERAIWVGWSLGGMIAMQAAVQQSDRILGLQLINTTPKFVRCKDWPCGVAASTLVTMKQGCIIDEYRVLRTFLALQMDGDSRSRAAIRNLASNLPTIDTSTLIAGLECLMKSDLRTSLPALHSLVPTHLVCGLADQIIDHTNSVRLAGLLGAPITKLNGGHAVFLTHPDVVAENLASLYASIVDASTASVTQCA